MSALRVSAITAGGIVLLFSAAVFTFREQVFSAFVADGPVGPCHRHHDPHRAARGDDRERLHRPAHVAVPGDRASAGGDRDVGDAGRAVRSYLILGNLWFGPAGIIWALTVTEGTVLLVGVVMWLVSRQAIDRGLAEGSPERADEVLA